MRATSSKAVSSEGAWREYSVRKMRTTSSFTQTGSVVLIRLVTSKSLRRKFMRLGLQTIVFVCFFWAFGPFPLRPIAHLKLFDSASQGGISDLFADWRSFRQASQRVPS